MVYTQSPASRWLTVSKSSASSAAASRATTRLGSASVVDIGEPPHQRVGLLGACRECARCGASCLADQEVALPVARDGPVVHLGGPLGDHDHVGDTPAGCRPGDEACAGVAPYAGNEPVPGAA